MDTDLIGVVISGVCIGILLIVIITFLIYCYSRRSEPRHSPLPRKDSGSVSTNGVAPRWAPAMMPSTMPVYSVPADPRMYAMHASHYYLGLYAPKFVDSDALEYMHQAHSQRRIVETEVEQSEGSRHTKHNLEHQAKLEHHAPQEPLSTDAYEQQTSQTQITEAQNTVLPETDQPNGHVVQDFSASSVNYRVIRKSHKHEKMPEWLRKTYDETERSLEMDDEDDGSSRGSSVRSEKALVIPDPPPSAVRATVSPRDSHLDSQDVLQVSPDFTIVDFVEPAQQGSHYHPGMLQDLDHPIHKGSRFHPGMPQDLDHPAYQASRYHPGMPHDLGLHTHEGSRFHPGIPHDLDHPFQQESRYHPGMPHDLDHTEETTYSSQDSAAPFVPREARVDASQASSYVPPASTSTPRPPPLPEEHMSPSPQIGKSRRMRREGDGDVPILPDVPATIDVQF